MVTSLRQHWFTTLEQSRSVERHQQQERQQVGETETGPRSAEVAVPWKPENFAAGKGDSFGEPSFSRWWLQIFVIITPKIGEDEPIVGLIRIFLVIEVWVRAPFHDVCSYQDVFMIVMGHEVMKFLNLNRSISSNDFWFFDVFDKVLDVFDKFCLLWDIHQKAMGTCHDPWHD